MGKKYAIIDVETTGGKPTRNRITEIAIVLHDGEQVIDRWSSLVNPETYVPAGITELTGITQQMVDAAPRFYEIARQVVEMTEGAVFVAHNARFDYSFVREEFKRLGFTYTRKQLCTVRLSRKAFPGLRSYGLSNLQKVLRIDNDARHRAMGDAMATAILLTKILKREQGEDAVRDLVNLGIREALLPQNLSVENIQALPDECGVYYFHNKRGEVIYVGKSISIQKRVAEHFAQKTEKARKLQRHVHDISFQLTGSELVALLLESHEIKRIRPFINRAQRIRRFPYVVHTWVNEAGYICFGVDQVAASERNKLDILSEYPKLGHARGHLARTQERFALCSSLLKRSASSGPCFHYHLKQCFGACRGQESALIYNERASLARDYLSTVFEQDFFILDDGRQPSEQSVILIEGGNYRGFGYVDRDQLTGDPAQLWGAVQPFEGNPETRRIIQRYLAKKKYQCVPIPKEELREW